MEETNKRIIIYTAWSFLHFVLLSVPNPFPSQTSLEKFLFSCYNHKTILEWPDMVKILIFIKRKAKHVLTSMSLYKLAELISLGEVKVYCGLWFQRLSVIVVEVYCGLWFKRLSTIVVEAVACRTMQRQYNTVGVCSKTAHFMATKQKREEWSGVPSPLTGHTPSDPRHPSALPAKSSFTSNRARGWGTRPLTQRSWESVPNPNYCRHQKCALMKEYCGCYTNYDCCSQHHVWYVFFLDLIFRYFFPLMKG